MTGRLLLLTVVLIGLSGCVQTRHTAPLHRTDVIVGQAEQEYLLRDVEAEAGSLHLLGTSSGDRTLAMVRIAGDGALRRAAFERIWASLPDSLDRRDLALVNVSEEAWASNFLLWTAPHLHVRADVVRLAPRPEPPAERSGERLTASTAPAPAAEQEVPAAGIEADKPESPEHVTYENPRLSLFGDRAISLNRGGYTWVVGSAVDPDAATDIAHHYRGMGYRADVITGVIGDDDLERVYRVAVGHFMTLDAAEEARGLLPDELPADAWILRLK